MMTDGLAAFIHDDITWCMEDNCPVAGCRRNPVNMMDRSGLHSFARFKGTAECPVSVGLDSCIDGCLYAKECFAKHDSPEDALQELIAEYCDDCMFACAEED